MMARCDRCGKTTTQPTSEIPIGGLAVRCSSCDHLFFVAPGGAAAVDDGKRTATDPRIPGGAASATTPGTAVWTVRKRDGSLLSFRELATLHEWAAAGRVTIDDEIARIGGAWRRIADVPEVASILAGLVENQTLDGKQPPLTQESPVWQTETAFQARPGASAEEGRAHPTVVVGPPREPTPLHIPEPISRLPESWEREFGSVKSSPSMRPGQFSGVSGDEFASQEFRSGELRAGEMGSREFEGNVVSTIRPRGMSAFAVAGWVALGVVLALGAVAVMRPEVFGIGKRGGGEEKRRLTAEAQSGGSAETQREEKGAKKEPDAVAGAVAVADAGAVAVAVAVAGAEKKNATTEAPRHRARKHREENEGEDKRPEARGGGSARSFLKAARRAYEDDDLPGALEKLRSALRLNPGLADAYILLGTVYKKMGEKQRALASFKKYLEVAPDGDEAAVARTNISELQE